MSILSLQNYKKSRSNSLKRLLLKSWSEKDSRFFCTFLIVTGFFKEKVFPLKGNWQGNPCVSPSQYHMGAIVHILIGYGESIQ
jgi:hypothetical protein